MKNLRKMFNNLFYLRPLELAGMALLMTFVCWGFFILLFSLEVR